MQRVLSAIERVDNLTDVNTVFKKSGVSKDIAEAVLQQSKFADNLDDIIVKATETSEAVTGMKKATSGLSDGTSKLTKFGNTMKGIGVSLMSFAKVAGVIAAIGGVIAAIDYATHGYTRAVEDATSAAESYAQQKSNVQALTSEYDTLQSKIRELQALQSNGTITMQQEIELANLQNQSAELERQLDIQKQILDAKAQASADAAMAASKEEMSYLEMNQEKYGTFKGIWKAFTGLFDTGINGDYQSDWEEWNKGDTTQIGLVKSNIAELESLNNELNNTREKLAKDANNEKLQKEETDLLEDIANVKTDLASEIETVQGWIEQSVDENGIPLKGYESFVDSLRDIVTEYQNIGKSVDEIDLNNLNNYFSSTSGKVMKDYLAGIVKKGGSAEDALNAFRESGMRLKDIDVSEDSFLRYFEDIARAANDAKLAVDGSFDGVSDAFQSANQGAKYDSMMQMYQKSKEMHTKGLWGTDDYKTIAQFGVGYDISDKLKNNADAYTYASDAYIEAYEKAAPLLERWYGNEDELINMQNVLSDFASKGLARNLGDGEFSFKNEDGSMMFKTTAEAAKAFETSVDNVELALDKLKEHGFEFDGIEKSGKLLSQYKSSLEGIKDIYNSMEDGDARDRLGGLLKGWEGEAEKFKDPNYLANLTEDQVLQIKFEYDIAQLQQELADALELAQATGNNEDWAAARIIAKNTREAYEEKTGYNEDFGDKGYTESYNVIEDLSASAKGKSEEARAEINAQITAIEQLQSAFQQFRFDGGELNWDEYLNSGEATDALNSIMEATGLTVEQLESILKLDSGDIKIDVDADTSKAEEKIKSVEAIEFSTKVAELTAVDDATPYLKLWNDLQVDPKFTSLSAEDQASYVVEIWNGLTPEQKEAYLNGEISVVDSATGEIQVVDSALSILQQKLSPQAKITATESATSTVATASLALDGIDGKTVNTYIVTHRSTVSGDSELSGTAHMGGTVGGLYPIPKLSGRALAMGTLQDDSWLKSSWRTTKGEVALVGEEGQELVATRANRWFTVGDNGAEFADIPMGSVVFNARQTKELLSKGRINSRGTAMIGGTAFASGGRLPGGVNAYPWNGSATWSGSNSYTPQPSSSTSPKSSSNSSSEKEFNEKIDEIEILLDRMESSLQRLTDSIETYSYDLSKQSEISTQAMNQIRTNLGTLQQAYNRYIQEANSVGLDEGWKQKVQNGAINIETITDSDLKDKIDEYQKWYEKSIDVQDKIAEMQQELLDLAVEKLDNIEQYFESRTDYNDNFGYLTPLTLLQESIDKFTKELEKQVSDGVIKEGSNEFFEAMEQLANMQEKLFEATIKKYQDIIDNLSRISDTLDNSIELKEARDEPILESDYKKQIDLNNQSVQEKYNKRQQLIKQQAIYDVGSEKYDELAEEISDIDDDIYGLLTDIEELKDKIWEVRWEPFFEGQEALKDLVDETDTFRDLLDSDAFVGKNGGLTADGLVNLALLSSAMNEQKQSIKNYSVALEKLQEDYDKGNISAKEFKETSKEFMDEIASGVANVENYKDEIISLYTEMLEKENDVVQSSINKQKELLDIKKRNSDYDRNVKKQVKDINTIQAQISALQGVNNESAKAELKRLNAELENRKNELDETQKDREYDVRQQGYDGLSDDLNNALEDTLDEVKYNASKQEEVISEMLNHVVNNYKDAYGKINQIIGNTGFKPSDDFQQNIDNLGSQSGASNQVQDSNTIAPNYKPDDFVGNTNTGQIQSDSAQGNNDRIESEIEKEPNTTNRPVAQLTLKPTSVKLEEGKSQNVTANIRPTDAANKTLIWSSSNTGVATVSNGTIKAVKPGSCQITASTTDGSGISATVGVNVTAKPKPKPPAPKPSGGDGVIRVGDKVTFTGSYYSDSWGGTPLGNLYAGVPGGVVVDAYSGSEYGGKSNFHGGYAIHIKSADGVYGDLGWVMPSQISGYAKGTRGIKKELEFAKINELGNELVIRRGGNDYTTLTYGSAVVPHDLSDKLFTLAKHTDQIINSSAGANGGNNVEVNNHYDSLLTVNGNVDRDALPGLKQILQQSYEYTSKKMYKDANLMGIQKKL